MRLIVGLGNPGKKYKKTRHNTGWFVLEALVSQIPNFKFQISNKYQLEYGKGLLDDSEVILAKPLTFMNNSGEAVKKLLRKIRPTKKNSTEPRDGSGLYIIHDDLDIPLGKYKIQFGKGPREHKGVESVEKALKTKNFWRVRVGVENRDFQDRISGEEYVLQEFTKEEQEIVKETIERVAKEVKRKILA